MTGHFFHRWMGLFPQLFLLAGLLLLETPAIAGSDTILIIKSSDNVFFNTSIEQLINQTHQKVKFHIMALESFKKDNSLLSDANLIITLGIDSVNYIQQSSISIPVIHSYITEFQYKNHKLREKQYSILLDQPLQRYLKFIKLLLGKEKIAIIRNNNNKISPRKIKSLSSTLHIKLEQHLYQQGDNPVNIVRDLLQSNDILLCLPDPEIYNRRSLKGILLTSYRQNKPLISYSPAQVKSGALAAIYSSPKNIGNQIAELVNEILQDKAFKPVSLYYAAEFEIKINNSVAKSLVFENNNGV